MGESFFLPKKTDFGRVFDDFGGVFDDFGRVFDDFLSHFFS